MALNAFKFSGFSSFDSTKFRIITSQLLNIAHKQASTTDIIQSFHAGKVDFHSISLNRAYLALPPTINKIDPDLRQEKDRTGKTLNGYVQFICSKMCLPSTPSNHLECIAHANTWIALVLIRSVNSNWRRKSIYSWSNLFLALHLISFMVWLTKFIRFSFVAFSTPKLTKARMKKIYF